VLSALSGNLGLQASTTTLRALTTGHASSSDLWQIIRVVRKELSVAFLIGVVSSISISFVASFWSKSLKFGLMTGLG
jgi:Mg/Co/Ni transporter MgtE